MINENVQAAIGKINEDPELLRGFNRALTRIFSSTGAQWTPGDKIEFLETMSEIMRCGGKIIVDEDVGPRGR